MGLVVHAPRRREWRVKILKRIGQVLLVLLVLTAVAYAFRRDPIGPIAGKQLSGEEAPAWSGDWSFSDAHDLVALEVRPDDPHSVTTICFLHEGALYVPSMGGSEKAWPQMVLADPRVRIKVGDTIYPARAIRVTDETQHQALLASAAKKYPRLAAEAGELPPDLWVFRIDPEGP